MSKGDNILVDAYSSSDADKVDLLERDLSFLSTRQNDCTIYWYKKVIILQHTSFDTQLCMNSVDHCQDRQAKRKKNTLFYSYGDIERRCRKTTPFVEGTLFEVFDDLMVHKYCDIPMEEFLRSQKVGFVIKQDAEEMLQALREYYLQLFCKNMQMR